MSRYFVPLLFLVFCTIASAEPVRVGDTVFQTNFTDLDGWSGTQSKFVSSPGGTIQIDLPQEGQDRFASISRDVSVANILDTKLRVEAKVKAKDVADPPKPYNGIKLMLVLDTPQGKQWLQKNLPGGTFDWKTVRFNVNVPETTTKATLVLGLEDVTGQVGFDDLQVKVIGRKPDRMKRVTPEGQPVYKGHDLPRLRGAMISPGKFEPDDIKVLAGDWKANHVRWQLIWAGFPNGPADTATVEEFDVWIDKQCEMLDRMLPECEKYGVLVTLDLHTPPGGRMSMKDGSVMRLFRDKKFQDAFVETWKKLAKRYKNAKAIWCYDILNEPVEGNMPEDAGILDWRALALKTSKEIRKIDPERCIVIEPAPWGDPNALEWFEPFDPKEVPNVVYSVHMYLPHNYTHQGVYDEKSGIEYPGKIDGIEWNKDKLRESLRVPIDFAKDFGVHLYIGEFSAIRWAPGASRYLNDCIDVFEENGWDWAYHAFREWDGWSVEHGPEKKNHKPAAETPDTQKVLRKGFEKNERK